ncbi:MAG: hypothetical protein A2836_02835 [Candidatus Taylorbacteria bacterium RIFCSPHIGHO2_01_FULL_45_63]|uniref:Glucosamine/galactosamine-6-phosphate isomerase domain-containing protein n=1 Tax=Candidatus Taylorbacteria bacterium RIFCSPHIGHO2_02_FULL_45_35 TaxID=1802311 RepID=A0A1G2MU73_9BACT|nr:MAG: hypothetical protein A2836_02835 [Candidatus Taylorbacteria bacterium RIFCSPHIGHO2_01_FULL_45_63]OHA26632.1 MAG: hypothetical protein A3D56_02250 [Candidatus Taylorbacteria bacterium RIFCSPHIGHO2_02_FULL_45_35]OHA33563.1 MAG: hypothetical protein A3A22_03555 [Candidatus Taylorbacteria bacterium RIFCSPLOWO2_01_FULL_45_34b]
MKLQTFKKELLAEASAKELNAALKKYGDDEREILLLLTGGSSMNMFPFIDVSLLGSHITLGVSDERFGNDVASSNFLQLKETEFYKNAVERDVNTIDSTSQGNESKEDVAARFEGIIRDWREENPKGEVIMTFGVGEDGHTAGVMPYPENPELFVGLFENPKHFVVAYDAGSKSKFPLRITTTLSFMREHLSFGIAFISGEGKREALAKIRAEEGTLPVTPARILRKLPVSIFTDIE